MNKAKMSRLMYAMICVTVLLFSLYELRFAKHEVKEMIKGCTYENNA